MRCAVRRIPMFCVIAGIAVSGALAQSTEWTGLLDQADAQERAGNYKQAAAGYEAALRIVEKFEADDPRIPIALNKLAIIYDQMGRFSDAEHLYRRALALVERTKGKTTAEYGTLLNNLAGLYLEQGLFAKAEPLIRETVAIEAAVLKADDPRLAMARSGLADLLIQRHEYAEAELLLNQAIQVFEMRPGSGRDLGIARNNLGVVRRYQKRKEESRRLLEDAVTAIENEVGPDHPSLARVLNNLGVAYAAFGLPEEAGRAFRRSIEIGAARLGVQHPVYGMMLYNYAHFLRDSGHKAEAKTLEAQSRAVIQESARRNGVGMTMDVSAFRRK